MAQFEYQVITHDIRARITHLNTKLNELVEEGWDPVSFSGDEHINIMLRRPAGSTSEQQESQQQ